MALPFFKNQKKHLDQVVAIDLGGRQTKAVLLQNKNDRLNLLGYALQDTPHLENGFTVDTLTTHLKGLFRPLGERTRHVTLAVGVPEAFLRHAELPPMPVSDMRHLLRLNSKTYLQQDLADYVFDCWVIIPSAAAPKTEASKPAPTGPARQKVLVGGTKQQTLDTMTAACRAAGMLAHQITPGMVAPVNAFEVAEPDSFAKEVVALVDIGFKNTTITMLKQGELVMNRVVTIGGDRLTAGLAESLGISYTEAEGIKIGMPAEVQQNLEFVIAPLGRELRASIDFFEHQQDVTVSQVWISGGSARSASIIRMLQGELMVPCRTWNPTQTLHLSLPAEQKAGLEAVAPQLAVALGAAVAAL